MTRIADTAPALPRRLLRREQAATYVGVSPNTFDKMVRDGAMPGAKVMPSVAAENARRPAIKVWDIRDLDAFADGLPYDDAPIVPEDTSWDG